MNTTEEQLAIVEATAQLRSSLMINAYAGCAKTTSLTLAAKEVRYPAMALAFNKAIASELKDKLPSNFTCRTFNSLGLAAWKSRGGEVTLDKDKQVRLLRAHAPRRMEKDQWSQLRRLFSLAQSRGMLPESPNWEDLTAELWADDCEEIIEIAKSALAECREECYRGVLSFDDQLWAPVCLEGARWQKWPLVMVDEAQDLSPLNREMVKRSAGGRIIAVGDRLQAIYAWRGAMNDSMNRLRELREDWIDLPLTMTFRCPRAVVERQRAFAVGFRAWEGVRDGMVLSTDRRLIVEAARAPLTVLCRNNAPLLSMAFELLRAGIGVKIVGKDIEGGLKTLAKKVGGSLVKLENWRISQREGKSEEEQEAVDDKADCLKAIIEGAGGGDTIALIERLFNVENGQTILSTIHKAKGLEWNRVAVLWTPPRGGGQERNIRYVGETRTRDLLVLEEGRRT